METWERKRLQVLRLVAEHPLKTAEIAEALDVGRVTVFRALHRVLQLKPTDPRVADSTVTRTR
jgi:DNA-binding IclR family transcriptional regulator